MATVIEVEAKKTSLDAELATALEAAKVLTPATPEFDEAYGRYLSAKAALAKIPDEVAAAKQSENAEAIAQCATQIAEAVKQLVEGLKVAELLGVPVKSLRYVVDDEGKLKVTFNPVVVVKATGAGKGHKAGGHTTILTPEGEHLSLTKFVLAHATEEEKATPEYKYPHAQVDSQPKFTKFCEAHSLTGFVYEMPSTS